MIIWCENKKRRAEKEGDVKIFFCNQKNARTQRISITFYNDTSKKLTETDHIRVGYNGEGLYFLGCSKGGHKLVESKKGNSKTRYTMLALDDAKPEWAGVYNLEFDRREMCHCIKFDKKVD